ncbi:hypothetical protein [Tenuifilum thalassicum]|uniref:Lipoprotein n=1 Tax=Tenuifilum thalassicum TaxID=2590900 RepID=A0A7D4BDE1_9BACT|nr:hypothetical protein [Tenuifilum thalassicum]QKG79258.1 hypothetical protein FHG85_02925 [Tenuifilum thalassicum]
MKFALKLALAIFTVYSCSVQKRNITTSAAKSNSLIPFVEYFVTSEGEVLSGKSFPGRRIDSPGYSYNPDNQHLELYRNSISDSTGIKLFLGIGRVLKGVSGRGVSSFIKEVKNFPYKHEELIIESYSDSTLKFTLKDKSFKLKPKESFTYTESKIDSLPNNTIVKTTTKWKVDFRGFVKK